MGKRKLSNSFSMRDLQRLGSRQGWVVVTYHPAIQRWEPAYGDFNRALKSITKGEGAMVSIRIPASELNRLARLYPKAVWHSSVPLGGALTGLWGGRWDGLPDETGGGDDSANQTRQEARPPDGPEESKYAPKGTDMVAEATSYTSNEVHGGNNRSYEVANSVSSNPADGKNDIPQRLTGKPSDAGQLSGSPAGADESPEPVSRAGERSPIAPDAVAHGQPDNPPSEEERAEADNASDVPPPRRPAAKDGVGSAIESVEPEPSAQRRNPAAGGIGGSFGGKPTADAANEPDVSSQAQPVDIGQWEADLAAALELPTFVGCTQKSGQKRGRSSATEYRIRSGERVQRKHIAAVRKALEEWVTSTGTQAVSMRWHGGKLATRALVKSQLHRAKREEMGQPGILVLVDTSGSCMGFSDKAARVALAISEVGMTSANIAIVTHGNGSPDEYFVNGKGPFKPEFRPGQVTLGWSYESFAGWYVDLCTKHSITHVLAIGDADGADVYKALSEREEIESFIWLDNFACNYAPLTVKTPKYIGGRGLRIYGCKDEDDLVRALEIAIRKGR